MCVRVHLSIYVYVCMYIMYIHKYNMYLYILLVHIIFT